jgi:hypothetical protein
MLNFIDENKFGVLKVNRDEEFAPVKNPDTE